MMLTGDVLRDHVSSEASDAKVRLIVDAHLLPAIQHEGVFNPTHMPPPGAAAISMFDVPWGGTGFLPGFPLTTYSTREFLAPLGRMFVQSDTYKTPIDGSCEAMHGVGAPECLDEMHVLWNHITTPFAIQMDSLDPLLSVGKPSYTDDLSYSWAPLADFSPRVEDIAADVIMNHATRSELERPNGDLSGTNGGDINDLKPSAWGPAVFVPRCGSNHTALIRDKYALRTEMALPGIPGSRTRMEQALYDFVINDTPVFAAEGFVHPAAGVPWLTSVCPP